MSSVAGVCASCGQVFPVTSGEVCPVCKSYICVQPGCLSCLCDWEEEGEAYRQECVNEEYGTGFL